MTFVFLEWGRGLQSQRLCPHLQNLRRARGSEAEPKGNTCPFTWSDSHRRGSSYRCAGPPPQLVSEGLWGWQRWPGGGGDLAKVWIRPWDWWVPNFKGSLPQFSQDPVGGATGCLPLTRRERGKIPLRGMGPLSLEGVRGTETDPQVNPDRWP